MYDDYDDYYGFESEVPDSLLTNFSKDKRTIYELSIKEYEKLLGRYSGIYIEDLAFSMRGTLLTDLNSLHILERTGDLSEFWSIVYRLEKYFDAINTASSKML